MTIKNARVIAFASDGKLRLTDDIANPSYAYDIYAEEGGVFELSNEGLVHAQFVATSPSALNVHDATLSYVQGSNVIIDAEKGLLAGRNIAIQQQGVAISSAAGQDVNVYTKEQIGTIPPNSAIILSTPEAKKISVHGSLALSTNLFAMKTEEADFQTNGFKKNHLLQIRLDVEQKKRLEALAIASGFKSVSDYVRVNLLNPSIEMKLNRIMDMLETNKSGDKNGKSK